MNTCERTIIKRDLFEHKERKRNFNNIRKFYDITEKKHNTIDDQTWDDLIMDNVYEKIDNTFSSQGESVLYTYLRNPSLNVKELSERRSIIKELRSNKYLLLKIRYIFYDLGYDNKNHLFDMISGTLKINKMKWILYCILGLIPLFLILGAVLFKEPYCMLVFAIYMYLPMWIHSFENKNIKPVGLIFLRNLIKASKRISKIESVVLKEKISEIDDVLDEIKVINKGTRVLDILNAFGRFLEMLSIPFLIEEIVYYKVSDKLVKGQNNILKLYYLVGELDVLSSIAIYEETNKELCSEPKFVEEVGLRINEGVHPLIEKSIGNSIEINSKGIILTGTNMSGKSTFLRMVSTNIILAQTFSFVLAKEYEGCLFNVVSSLSPKDDIIKGKSYYLAEAESILRIIEASKEEVPLFCPIDEIFRGTNPLERISSSAEILRYIQRKNSAICIVATHDKELSEILKDEYDFYYFSETVDEEKGLSFDYKIKRGVSKSRNAIKLLDYMGYPKEIIENSYNRIDKLQNYM